MSDQNTRIERLPFTTDQGAGARAALGLLVLESDRTMEWELSALTRLPGVALYHSRLANDVTVTPDTLAKMADELPVAAKLLPEYLRLSAIGYGCTSGSTIIGESRVAEIINEIHPGVAVSNPLTAAKAALNALGITRLGLVTPYSPDVTSAMQQQFEQSGISVSVVGSFYEPNDEVVGVIDQRSILQAAIDIGQSNDVDGVFIACTNLRAWDIIAQAESQLNKPVTASNHALGWHLLRLSGIDDTLDNSGQLFHKTI